MSSEVANESAVSSQNSRSGEVNEVHHHHHHHHHYSGRSKKQSSMAEEVSKERRKKICLRTLFIALMIAGIVILVVMIVSAGGKGKEGGFKLFSWDKQATEQMTTEIDELKKENMQLRYELEKYKEKYGEIENSSNN